MLLRYFAGLLGLLGLLLWPAFGPAADKDADTTPKVVKFTELKKLIGDQKGKVVVVDLWMDSCAPCKREFPNLVALHQKYANEGLVAMSINLDDPKDKKVMGRVHDFLKENKAIFANYVLDEAADAWPEKFGIEGVPVVFVFGRDGKPVKKYEDEGAYRELAKLLPDLLKKK